MGDQSKRDQSPGGGGSEARPVFRDPRIDRVITWLLLLAATTALSMGAYFFQRLDGKMASLDGSVGTLNTAVILLQKDATESIAFKAKFDEFVKDHQREKDSLMERIHALELRLATSGK